MAQQKICIECHKDVTVAPRSKDDQGNYYCADCAAAVEKGRVSAVLASKAVVFSAQQEHHVSNTDPSTQPNRGAMDFLRRWQTITAIVVIVVMLAVGVTVASKASATGGSAAREREPSASSGASLGTWGTGKWKSLEVAVESVEIVEEPMTWEWRTPAMQRRLDVTLTFRSPTGKLSEEVTSGEIKVQAGSGAIAPLGFSGGGVRVYKDDSQTQIDSCRVSGKNASAYCLVVDTSGGNRIYQGSKMLFQSVIVSSASSREIGFARVSFPMFEDGQAILVLGDQKLSLPRRVATGP